MRQEVVIQRSRTQNLWMGIPGIEVTPAGRLFVAWFSGGFAEPHPENRIFLQISDDDGHDFSTPQVLVDPEGSARAFDPTLWLAPTGDLYLIYNLGDPESGFNGIEYITCSNPDHPKVTWTPPTRIAYNAPFSFRINKPIVLSNGDWAMPVTWSHQGISWDRETAQKWRNPSALWDFQKLMWKSPATDPRDWFPLGGEVQGIGLSSDNGQTWQLHGAVESAAWSLENMLVQRSDGTIIMYMRTGEGHVWQSNSQDNGRTWTPAKPTELLNPGTRFFIAKLSDGTWLLINTPDPKARKAIYAYRSHDEGQTWTPGYCIDPRNNVSYPDAAQSTQGTIYVVHDFDRYGSSEIILSLFSPEEIG